MNETKERSVAANTTASGTAVRWGVAIDLRRCTGCQSCTVACKAENGTPPGVFWTRVLEKEEGVFPFAFKLFMPVRCNHCGDPPCVSACPSGASYKRDKDNLVLIDQDQCIGCGSCVVACPYDARSMPESGRGYYQEKTPYEQVAYEKWEKGTAQKCTLCVHRLDRGLKPACIETCPTRALVFGDLNDPNSDISKLVRTRTNYRPGEGMKTDPSVYYLT